MTASITSLQESHTELNQRLDTLEATQAIILENQSVILNLLCEVASANGISTDDVPKGEKNQKTKQQKDGKRKRGGTEKNKEEKQVRKKSYKEASKETCKPNAKDARKDDSDDGDNQPLRKRVRLASYRTKSSQTGQVAAISTSKDIKTPSDKGKQVHRPECYCKNNH